MLSMHFTSASVLCVLEACVAEAISAPSMVGASVLGGPWLQEGRWGGVGGGGGGGW